MRLFLAIELSPSLRKHLIKIQDTLKPLNSAVSWTRPENLHLTLKFLGEVPDERVKALCDALEKVPSAGPIDLTPDRMTCFPPRGAIRIVGAGLAAPPALAELAIRIDQACHTQGFRLEGRPFTAHVTLARAKDMLPPSLRPRMEQATSTLFPGPTMHVEGFALVQSQLRRDGAVYTPAAHFYV